MPSGVSCRLIACPSLAIDLGAWIATSLSRIVLVPCRVAYLVFVSYPFTIFVLRWLKSQVQPCDLVTLLFDSAVMRSILSPIRIVHRLTLPVRKSCHCKQPSASPSFLGRFHISYSVSSRIRSCIAASRLSDWIFCDCFPISLNLSELRSARCFWYLVMSHLITMFVSKIRITRGQDISNSAFSALLWSIMLCTAFITRSSVTISPGL